MLATMFHLLAQTPVEQAQNKSAAEEGKDIVLAMLVVGLVFVAVAVGGDLLAKLRKKH
jgi:hypothetical protein